jgi:EAL domain-containing protein (putative c-di-GMP-specific phosphodiesterase class I)
MYHSKTHEDEKINFYSISMSEHINRRNLLEQELRIAIETNDESLCIYFQPQINVKTSTVIGFEALSRWIHPTLGTISPEEFIPIAEDSGLIIPLGRRVIRQACQQLKQCHAQGYNDLRIAVNISAKQFLLANVPLDVLEIIESENIDAKYLELELTESLVVDNPEKTIVMLTALKEMGIRLSIDDFGTGYSSLSYLSQFPLDILKIDKSFINQMETNNKGLALTQTIIAIAHNLSLEVVAEGVETEQQLNLLRKLSCEYVQGYFFSKPIPASEITSLLEKKWD